MENSFQNFESISKEAWAQQLEKDLKGTTFEDLMGKDLSGLDIHPFYTKEDLPEQISPLFDHSDWSISTYIHVENNQEEKANALALEELGNGVQSIVWSFENIDDINWVALFEQIQLDIIESFIILPTNAFIPESLLYFLNEFFAEHAVLDLVTILQDNVFEHLMNDKKSPHPYTNTLYIQGQDYAHLGLNTVDQVAYILAHLQETLHLAQLQNTLKAIHSIHIGVANNTQYFEEIAKMRVLYKTIPIILEEYGINVPFYFHAETSLTYLTAEDNPNNILRNAIASMSAVLGGCHYLYIHPHKSDTVQPQVEARRVSRNQQHLFKEESYFNKIADAAHGSYTIESRTQDILENAWDKFLSIEREGGILAKKEAFTTVVKAAQEQLLDQYQSGELVLIGYNKFLLEEDASNIALPFEAKTFANGLRYFQLPLLKK